MMANDVSIIFEKKLKSDCVVKHCSKIHTIFMVLSIVLLVINVRPPFFYTKPFVYNSVFICLIMIKLIHHTF